MRWIAIAWALTLTAHLYSQPQPQAVIFPPTRGEYLVLPYEVIDGDTFRFYYLIESDPARLWGIDAPETHGPTKVKGLEAKKYFANVLPEVPVKAVFKGREKYGRALIDLYTSDGKSLSEIMVEAKHAVPYFGGKR